VTNSEHITRSELQNDLGLGILQLVFALLFCAIYYIFITSFGGEFLIVVKGLWTLSIFLILLIGGAIASVILSARSLRAGVIQGNVSDQWGNTAAKSWLIGWSVFNILVSFPILFLGKVLALGALGSVPIPLIGLLALPFIGYAVMFIFGSVRSLIGLAQHRSGVRLMRGAVLSGFPFLFVFACFALISAFWNPQWTEGVQHMQLFTPGEEPGRDYRIPAMIVLPDDVLLAFAESRVEGMSDLLDINIVMKRSLNGGKTWSPIQVLEDVGKRTVHSPAPVFDQDTQTVWLPFCIDYETLYITESTDAGVTWSEPRNLSNELGLPAGTWCHNGPGNGIQMSTGRLVIPTSQGEARVLYSDDHGASWLLGEAIGRGEEPQVFERANGTLCANLRNQRGEPRIVACSQNGGMTWEPWRFDENLPDAGTQASIMRFSSGQEQMRNRILFSNPGAPYRGEFTIRMSYDEGQSWPVSKLVYEGAAGYSQLAVLSDYTILALFETGKYDLRESITLIRVDLNWLTNGNDSLTVSTTGN
jgi:sialidase-1